MYATVDKQVEHPAGYYINHSTATEYNSYDRVRGAYLTQPDAENFSLNVSYFYLDDVVAYDQTMRNNVMNTRVRVDFYTLWPELTSNDIRLCGNPTQAYGSHDNDENGGENGGFRLHSTWLYEKLHLQREYHFLCAASESALVELGRR